MKQLFYRFALTAVIIVIAAYGALIIIGVSENEQHHDLAVVLGNKVNIDGSPSPRLAARLEQAYILWIDQRCFHILVSGGTGIEGWDEAVVMKSYLVDKGVPEDIIIVDSEGDDTWKTALNTEQVLAEVGGESVVAVSQFFHIFPHKVFANFV